MIPANSSCFFGVYYLLVRFTQGMDGLLGVAGIIINNYYGSFPHSLRLAPVRKLDGYYTLQIIQNLTPKATGWVTMNCKPTVSFF